MFMIPLSISRIVNQATWAANLTSTSSDALTIPYYNSCLHSKAS